MSSSESQSPTSYDVADQRQQKGLLFQVERTNYSTHHNGDSSSDQDSDSHFLNSRPKRSVQAPPGAPQISGWFSVLTTIFTVNLGKYIPATLWLREYDKTSFWSDFFSGLTLGWFTIPQAIAYSMLAGVPPVVGLYTACIPSIIYAIFGTSKHLNIGPDAVVCLMIGTFVREIILREVEDSELARVLADPIATMAYTTIFTLVTGMLLLCFGLLRLGFLDSLLSAPVIDGLILSVVTTIIISQLPVSLGMSPCTGTDCPVAPLSKFIYMFRHITDVHLYTFLFSLSVLVVLLLLSHIKNRFSLPLLPSVLITIALAVTVAALTHISDHGVAVLGAVDVRFHWPTLPASPWIVAQQSLRPALSVACIVFVKANVIARHFAQRGGYSVDANQELCALGVANMIGAAGGAIVASGCIGRTKLGNAAGTRTQMANVIAAVICLLAIIALLPLMRQLPLCALSVLIMHTVAQMYGEHTETLRKGVAMRAVGDVGVCVGMVVVSLLVDVETALIFGFAGSMSLLVKRASGVSVQMLGVRVYRKSPAVTGHAHTTSSSSSSSSAAALTATSTKDYLSTATDMQAPLLRDTSLSLSVPPSSPPTPQSQLQSLQTQLLHPHLQPSSSSFFAAPLATPPMGSPVDLPASWALAQLADVLDVGDASHHSPRTPIFSPIIPVDSKDAEEDGTSLGRVHVSRAPGIAPPRINEAVYTVPGVVVLRVHGALHFATIGSFKALCDRAVELACTCQPHGIHTIVKNMGKRGAAGLLAPRGYGFPGLNVNSGGNTSNGPSVSASPDFSSVAGNECVYSDTYSQNTAANIRPRCDCARCAEGWEGAWLPKRAPLQALVIDLGLVPSLDVSAVAGLQELAEHWLGEGSAVVLVVPQGDAGVDKDQTRMYLHEYRRRQRFLRAQWEREEKERMGSKEVGATGLADLELGNSEDRAMAMADENAPTCMSPSSAVISRVPSAFLPALMPARWRSAAAAVAALLRASPTKPLPALALGGVVEGLGNDALFHSVEEALVALHHRGVIPLPPTTME